MNVFADEFALCALHWVIAEYFLFPTLNNLISAYFFRCFIMARRLIFFAAAFLKVIREGEIGRIAFVAF